MYDVLEMYYSWVQMENFVTFAEICKSDSGTNLT